MAAEKPPGGSGASGKGRMGGGGGDGRLGTGRGKGPVGDDGDEVKALSPRPLSAHEAEVILWLRSVLHNVNFLFEGLHEGREDLERTTGQKFGLTLLTEFFIHFHGYLQCIVSLEALNL